MRFWLWIGVSCMYLRDRNTLDHTPQQPLTTHLLLVQCHTDVHVAVPLVLPPAAHLIVLLDALPCFCVFLGDGCVCAVANHGLTGRGGCTGTSWTKAPLINTSSVNARTVDGLDDRQGRRNAHKPHKCSQLRTYTHNAPSYYHESTHLSLRTVHRLDDGLGQDAVGGGDGEVANVVVAQGRHLDRLCLGVYVCVCVFVWRVWRGCKMPRGPGARASCCRG